NKPDNTEDMSIATGMNRARSILSSRIKKGYGKETLTPEQQGQLNKFFVDTLGSARELAKEKGTGHIADYASSVPLPDLNVVVEVREVKGDTRRANTTGSSTVKDR